MLNNLPANAGDMGSIPAWGTKIPYAVEQLSLSATTTEPVHPGACAPQQEDPLQWEACTPPPEKAHEQQQRPRVAKSQ